MSFDLIKPSKNETTIAMEREIIFNLKILGRISLAISEVLDIQQRTKAGHSIPEDCDLSKASFSFGQYKGRLINQIWLDDKKYIKKLSRESWLSQYPIEYYAIHTLLANQKLFK